MAPSYVNPFLPNSIPEPAAGMSSQVAPSSGFLTNTISKNKLSGTKFFRQNAPSKEKRL
jgi:hypothetical protein